jgi:hypothetical protein
MTAHAGVATGSGRTTTSPFSRVYGLGTVYAKTLRDSRLAVIIVAGLAAAFLLSGGAAFGEAYHTQESRTELANLVRSLPPVMIGVYGNPFPANMETLGGSLGWKTAASIGLMAAIWSVLALSGTLAREARRGSLDFVAVTPLGTRRIALEKVSAHLTGMAIVVVVTALCTWVAGPRSPPCRVTRSHPRPPSATPCGSAASPSRRVRWRSPCRPWSAGERPPGSRGP